MSDIIIKAVWDINTRKYYEKLGYIFTNYGDLFEVKESDFSKFSKMKIWIQCQHCGKYFEMEFRNYYNRVLKHIDIICNECSINIRLDNLYQMIVEICKEKKYKLITKRNEIIDIYSEIIYICPKHGEVHTKIRYLIEGRGCYKCGRDVAVYKKNKTTLKDRQESLYKKALIIAEEKGYILLSNESDIINNQSYIIYVCPKHGIHRMRISNFINGKMCPDCAKENQRNLFKLSPDEVEKRINDCGSKLLNKQEYKNQTEKNLLIECLECRTPFITSLRNFEQHGGQLCPNCSNSVSIGEKRIRIYLEDNNIKFESQKWFSDCRDKKPLPFDFYLPDFNMVIEFDGRQHFGETNYFTYSFEETKRHDEIKNLYCKNKNIKIVRIPYWNINNIKKILDKELI